MNLLQVLIVSDHPVVRAGLAAIVAAEDDCQVAGEATPAEVVAQAALLRPDVVLLDAVDDDADGLETLAQAAAELPELPLLLIGREAGARRLREALRAGARGYILWDAAGEEVAAALRAVEHGLLVLDPRAARQLLEEIAPRGRALAPSAADSAAEPLTPRELEVLQLLAQGLPSKTISARLHLSEHTVKFHVGSILAKLGAASRTEAVTLAIRRGLVAL